MKIEANFITEDGILLGTWDLNFQPKVGDIFEDLRFTSVTPSTDGSDFDIKIEYL
jgi:hypothetical protein